MSQKYIIMAGPSLRSMGGMATVVHGYEDAGLFDRWRITYLETHVEGSKLAKAVVALRSLCVLVSMLAVRRVVLLHVHVAERVSFWRKLTFITMALVAGCPVVFHLHGCEFMEFFFERCGPVRRAIVRFVLRHAACVIALSEQWRENVLSMERRAHVVRIVNSVAIPDLDGVDPGQRRAPILLFLGLLGPRKGIYDLLSAISRLRERFPDIALRCGGNGELEEVSRRVEELGIGENVELLGWVRGGDKERLFSEAAVYVLPSYNEGMPMGILEAMAHGLPVVASRAGGIPEVIEEGREGVLVDAGDVDGLVAAIESLLSDGDLRARMGVAARNKVVEKFSAEVVIPQVEAIYRSLGARPVEESVARVSS